MASNRVKLTLKPIKRFKNNHNGKRYDLIIFKDNTGREYRYNTPVTIDSELTKIGTVVGGYDTHYCKPNSTPINLTAELEVDGSYTWLIKPRLCKDYTSEPFASVGRCQSVVVNGQVYYYGEKIPYIRWIADDIGTENEIWNAKITSVSDKRQNDVQFEAEDSDGNSICVTLDMDDVITSEEKSA